MDDPGRVGKPRLTKIEEAVAAMRWDEARVLLGEELAGRSQPGLRVLLAQVLRELGLEAEAEAELVTLWQALAPERVEERRAAALELADLRLAAGRLEEAARALRRVLEVEPNQWEALALLGDVFYDRRAWDEAVRAYREAAGAHPFNADLWWNMGLAAEMAEDWQASVEAFGAYMQLGPELPEREEARERLHRALEKTGGVD